MKGRAEEDLTGREHTAVTQRAPAQSSSGPDGALVFCLVSLHFSDLDVCQWFPVRLQNVLNTVESLKGTSHYSADHNRVHRASVGVRLKCLLLT